MGARCILLLLAGVHVACSDRLAEALETLRHPLEDLELQQLVQANALLSRRDVDGAEQLARAIIKAHPADPSVLTFVGVLADSRGEPEQAVAALERAVLLDPKNIELQLVLVKYYIDVGNAFAARMVAERVATSSQATEKHRTHAVRLLEELKSTKPILNAFSRALAKSDMGAVASTSAVLLRGGAGAISAAAEQLIAQCEFRATRSLLELAVEYGTEPHLAFTRARVERFLGDEDAALKAATESLKLSTEQNLSSEKDFFNRKDGHEHGMSWKVESLKFLGRYHEAFAKMREDFETGTHKFATDEDPAVTIFKLEHDAEQLLFLNRSGLLDESVPLQKIVSHYKKGSDVIKKQLAGCMEGCREGTCSASGVGQNRRADCYPVRSVSSLPKKLASGVQRYINRPHNWLSGSEWKGRPVLNPNLDKAAIETAYKQGVAVIDDFLTEAALQELLALGLQSTMWNQVKAGGYLGAYLQEDGFAPPVVAQLALELEAALPNIFQQHKLLTFWGFKHDTVRAPEGIKAHADTAAINLNFWVVPDESNRNPKSGGLVVYKHQENLFRTERDYNSYDVGTAELGLTVDDVLLRVPHRQNRAVLFPSHLYHATDTVEFREGFENCRMNYTLLFGFLDVGRCAKKLKVRGARKRKVG